jgi:RNA polymerase sigma factor (sigma-70 family)
MLKFFRQKSKGANERDIYNLYADKMLFVCYRYLNNLMDAEEVLHNGFIKVFDNIGKFEERHEKGFEYWVKKIMVNESLMFLRKRINFKLISIDDVNEKEFFTSSINDEMEPETFFNVLNELPVGYKTIFNLFAIEEYSHKEIAKMLGITESTSRSQLTKARKLLQHKILKNKESLYA